MRDFEYEAPTTLASAVELLQRHGGAARPLAGGTDLIDHVRTGRLQPDVIVDVKHIPELNELSVNAEGLRLGAAVSCRRIVASQEIQQQFSALHDACSIIGGMQIQSRASVGGNLCTSGAAADTTPALIALEAQCVIAGPAGTRTLPVEEFCTGPAQNVLGPGELLVELQIPAPSQAGDSRAGSHYRRFIPRNEMDIAVVGVGAALRIENGRIAVARVGLGAVAPRPLLAREVGEFVLGKEPNEETFAGAGILARRLISPIDDHRGTREFRIQVTGVLVQRVLAEAARRATGPVGL